LNLLILGSYKATCERWCRTVLFSKAKETNAI